MQPGGRLGLDVEIADCGWPGGGGPTLLTRACETRATAVHSSTFLTRHVASEWSRESWPRHGERTCNGGG